MGCAKSSLDWISSDAVVVRFCRACTKTYLSAVADAPKHTPACLKRQLDCDWTLFLGGKHRIPSGVSSSSVLGVAVKFRVIHLFAFTALFDKQRTSV